MSLFKEIENTKDSNVWKELDSVCSAESYFMNNNEKKKINDSVFESFQSDDERRAKKKLNKLDPEEMIKQAKARAEQIEQEAYEKGFSQGEKDGFQLGEQKAQKLVNKIMEILEGFNNITQDIIKHHEGNIISLIYAISEKIIHKKIESGEYDLREIILKAIDSIKERNKIKIHVNSQDYELMKTLIPEIEKKIKDLGSIDVVSNSSIKKGGCIVESSCGSVDATIETRLKIIRDCIEKTYKGIRV